MQSESSQSRVVRCGEIFLWTLLIVLIVRFCTKSAYEGAMGSYGSWGSQDFGYFYNAAKNFHEVRSIYAGDKLYGYVYTPLVALVFQPLAKYPIQRAYQIWSVAQCAFIIASALCCTWALGRSRYFGLRFAVMILVGFRFWPTTLNFADGQTNFVLVLLVCMIILAASGKHWYWVALLIAAGALIKTWMLGLGVYLLLRRAWKPAIYCGVIFTAAIVILFSITGWGEYAQFIRATRDISAQSTFAAYTIPGMARIYFKPNSFIDPVTTDRVAYLGFLIAGYGALLLGLWYISKGVARSAYESSLQIGVVVVSVVLVLPVCHPAYVVLSLPLLWTLITGAITVPNTRRLFPHALALLIYIALTVGLPVFTRIPAGWQSSPRRFLLAAYFYAMVATWGLGLLCLWLSRRDASQSRS